MILNYIKFLFFLLAFQFLNIENLNAQHFNQNKGNVEIIGIANDTVFNAYSKECLIIYYSSINQFEITIPLSTLESGKDTIDRIFHSNNNSTLKITTNVEGSVFDLFRKENSNHDHQLSGELRINNSIQTIQKTYRIYTTPSRKQNEKTMFLDLRLYFDPMQLEIGEYSIFSNPMELIIKGGYVNQKN